ncbi:MAG: transglycosylase domain-containing protein [Patescibacteria group bacterium]|nr:transglycosylase domain-containing protein [Patescibacteria group bacterium]
MNTPGSGRGRRPRSTITTQSGKTIKVNRTMSDRLKARKQSVMNDKAAYLSTLPKDRLHRILYRLHPKRVAAYWFSRQGGVMALKIIGIAIIAGFFLTIGLFAYFRKDLPKVKDISGSDLGGSITYYDRTGQTVLWQDYDAVKRIPVEDKDISPFIKMATVAIEDKDYFKHGAFDVRGIARAGAHDLIGGGGSVQGGSTITQQFVKLNEQWTDNRTVTRKVKELILAVELEREYSKKDILAGYLNAAPYGGVEYGVESAARDYFQTSAKDLTLAQSAMLAAIPQAPSYYSPYGSSKFNPAVTADTFNQAALIGRQHYILDQMVKQGYITTAQANDAKKVDVLAQVKLQAPKYQGIKAPYFVLAAKQELQQKYGANIVQRGGWKVTTTLNMDLQNKAEDLVATNLKNISRYGADQEAVVGEEVQTGQIVSLVGGTDFTNPDYGQNNYAAGIKIPPGSSFKPYDYATFINNNNNVGAGSVLYDSQTTLPGYPCTNKAKPKDGGNCLQDYDFRYPGAITLRYALGGSRNVPAVKAMLQAVPGDTSVGKVNSINKVISTASAMMANPYAAAKHKNTYNCYGDESLTVVSQCYAASAIGDGAYLHLDDHVNGLSTLARLGNAIPRTYILKVTDAGNRNLYQWTQPKANQVIKADAAFIVNSMASDGKASYLPASYKFQQQKNGWNFAVKTGTTNDGYDGLMTSWSTKYAFVSWVGNHNRHVTLRSSMENLTEPLTRGWMEYAHTNEKPVNWTQPATIKTSAAFVVRSHVGIGSIEPSPTNDIYPGYYIGGTGKSTTSETTDRVSGKVATSCTPAAAKQTVTNGNANFWNVDTFSGGKANLVGAGGSTGSSTPAPQDDVHNCNDAPPNVTLTAPGSCDTSCTITATVSQGTHPLSDSQYAQFPGTVTFTLDGQAIHTENVTDSPSTVSFTYSPTGSGSGNLVVNVTDSVLYQGSDSATLNFTVPQAQPTGAVTQPGDNQVDLNLRGTINKPSNTVTFQWTGGTGPYNVANKAGVPVAGCAGVKAGTSSCTSTTALPKGEYQITDSAGNKGATTV